MSGLNWKYASWKNWKYKNTLLLIISLFVIFYLVDTDLGQRVVSSISKLGYLGSFIAGILFVSTYTVVPAGVVLVELTKTLDASMIILTASLGGVIGDYVIFRFLKDHVFEEIKPVFMKLGGSNLSRLISTPYFAWLAPVVGALIMASPFPDELGITLMGISKLKNWQFIVISFVLNVLGLTVIIAIAKTI